MSSRSQARPVRDLHPLADKTVVLNANAADPKRGMVIEGAHFEVEDWWENLDGDRINLPRPPVNWSEMHYVERLVALKRFHPTNKPAEAVYGKIQGHGHIVHVSELGDVVPDE